MIGLIDLSIFHCESCLELSGKCHCLYYDDLVKRAAAEIATSLSVSGFMQVTGHDIDQTEIDKCFEESSEFFIQPMATKLAACSKDKARRGYSPSKSENYASLIGKSGEPNDTVEKFRIGPFDDCKEYDDDNHFKKEALSYFFPNDFSVMSKHFEEVYNSYYESMATLAARILRIIEFSLGFTSALFSDKLDRHTSILTINYYTQSLLDHGQKNTHDVARKYLSSALPIDNGGNGQTPIELRVAEHTDVSLITVVAQSKDSCSVHDGIGGLEVYESHSQSWIPVPYVPGAFTINIGDCLSDCSGGRLKSNLHRVVMRRASAYHCPAPVIPDLSDDRPNNRPDADTNLSTPNQEAADIDNDTSTCIPLPVARSSLAFFFTPNYNALLEWPSCDSPNRWETLRDVPDERRMDGLKEEGQTTESLTSHPLGTLGDCQVAGNSSVKNDTATATAITYAQWRKNHIKKAMDSTKKLKIKQPQ